MLIRTFPIEWNDLSEMEIDTWKIQMLDRKFTRLVNFEDDDDDEADESRQNLVLARGILESAIILVKNLFESNEFNSYIRDVNDKYAIMIENLGRANKSLDSTEKETIQRTQNSQVLADKIISNSSNSVIYAKNLVNYMDHFVFYPLYKGYLRFLNFHEEKEVKNKEGKFESSKVKKDKKLLIYFIFFEFYKASEILGTITRQEKKDMSTIGYTPLAGGKKIEGVLSDVPNNPELEMTEPSSMPDEFEVFN
jgi:hypothetical protein